jgi:hypothetical protein
MISVLTVIAVVAIAGRTGHPSDHDDGETDLKARPLNLSDHFAFKSPGDPTKLTPGDGGALDQQVIALVSDGVSFSKDPAKKSLSLSSRISPTCSRGARTSRRRSRAPRRRSDAARGGRAPRDRRRGSLRHVWRLSHRVSSHVPAVPVTETGVTCRSRCARFDRGLVGRGATPPQRRASPWQ